MVIDIINNKKGQYLFNCQYWSDFGDENERFFIGSLQSFGFLTIHDIALKYNYSAFIRPMNMLEKMIGGFKHKQCAISSEDVWCLSALLTSRSSSSKVPVYIKRLFRNFTNNINRIEIDLNVMSCHKKEAKKGSYGYKLFKPIFFISSMNGSAETIDFTKLLTVFTKKVETVIIFNRRYHSWDKSISLDALFISSMISAIKVINKSVSLRASFKEFIIMNPAESITDFIKKNESLFLSNQWTLKKKPYKHIRRGAVCDETLFIEPL